MKAWTLAVALLLGGCALEPVEPWQRENLARPEMRWKAGLVQESAMRAHVYSSKEAGGGSAAHSASGCGCN
ncbi:MAG: DUF4266 domain-containing protein [Pseudomonadota bacterium]